MLSAVCLLGSKLGDFAVILILIDFVWKSWNIYLDVERAMDLCHWDDIHIFAKIQ